MKNDIAVIAIEETTKEESIKSELQRHQRHHQHHQHRKHHFARYFNDADTHHKNRHPQEPELLNHHDDSDEDDQTKKNSCCFPPIFKHR